MRTVSKSATFLATESVNSAPFKRGETEVQIFWQGIEQNTSSILRCTFLARRRAKLIANFSATMVTSLPSFSLSLCISLSLSPNVPHAQYRKRFRASYNKQKRFLFGQASLTVSVVQLLGVRTIPVTAWSFSFFLLVPQSTCLCFLFTRTHAFLLTTGILTTTAFASVRKEDFSTLTRLFDL